MNKKDFIKYLDSPLDVCSDIINQSVKRTKQETAKLQPQLSKLHQNARDNMVLNLFVSILFNEMLQFSYTCKAMRCDIPYTTMYSIFQSALFYINSIMEKGIDIIETGGNHGLH